MKRATMAGLASACLALCAARPAQAWWHGGYGGGFGFGFVAPPLYAAPPVYLAPPAYDPPLYAPPVYAPPVYAPPVYGLPAYAPPAYGTGPVAGQSCFAGPYVCALGAPVPAGGSCACAAGSGRVFGRAG